MMHRTEESVKRRYLLARAGDDRIALDMRAVRGVTSDLTLLGPAGHEAFPGLRGVKNVRGAIVPVLDLGEARGEASGEDPRATTCDTRLVLFANRSDDALWGLLLDEVIGVREIRARDVSVPHLRESGGAVAFLHFDEECVPVVDPEALRPRDAAAA